MPDQSFLEIWQLLQLELEARNRQLQSRYETVFSDLSTTVQDEVISVQQQDVPTSRPGEISSIRSFVQGAGKPLLFEPIRSFRRARPQERVLEAIENHDAGLDDLIRRVPQTVNISGPELVDVMGPHIASRVSRYLLLKRDRVTLPLRRIVELQFLSESEQRSKLDGTLLLFLSQSSLLLLSPWQDLRRYVLRNFAGQDVDERAWDRSRGRWLRLVEVLMEQISRRLPALGVWNARAANRLAAAILRGRPGGTPKWSSKLLLKRQANFRYWSRQQRAVTGLLDLEWDLTEMLGEVTGAAADVIESLDAEQAALLGELDSVIAWLQESQSGEIQGEFPPPVARLVSAEDRLSGWERLVEASARNHLPLVIETIEPRHDLPRRREPWKPLEPNKQFHSAVARVGRLVVLEGFREVEGAHGAIVRVIERAREVVRFSLETAEAEPEEGSTVAREGLANALALVSYQRQAAADPHGAAERKLVQGIAQSFLLAHLSIEQRRLGLLTQLIRESGSRAAHETGRAVLDQLATAGRWVRDHIRRWYHWFLLKVGWEAVPIAIQAPIVARGYLGEVLSLQLGARDLPMIYRRLFRLAPVEEPRFLVGREAEMAALAHARNLWHSNRSVSVILVGDRGSGKTSLLNCAAAKEFSDVEVIRSQFSQRITDGRQMHAFLRKLMRIPAEQDLMEVLLSGKRIIMLEELERTFLRRMNGFAGLEELLSIVSGSSRTTLWIICLNQHCYRYLDAAVNIGQYFSHRINAMAIPPEQLKKAILLRHNLSGLRLQYPALPDDGESMRAMQRVLGLEPNAEDSFFDSLYRQSEGIFRSAFELWQHFMERVEGGVLYLQQPAEPNYEPLVAQFTQQDSFTLQAILQHGSLTVQDHAEIFECSSQRSRVALEKLINLECLEEDPAGPGLRIRPEAGRLIHMTLHRQNLI